MIVPGQLFIGTLSENDKRFLKPLMENARKGLYTRFVEPCAGALAMSYIAAESGYKPQEIEASDISLFSGVLGRKAMGVHLDDMGIQAEGFSAEDLATPEGVMYAQMYLKTAMKAGHEYFSQILRDLAYRKQEHLAHVKEQVDSITTKLSGMNYRDLCMWKHLEEALDDEHALIVICPPTYTSGYEKFFDTGGRMTWREPEFGVFDPKTGLYELHEKARNAKALLICYEECEQGMNAGAAIYGRAAGRPGINMYLTSNRPDEAIRLAGGKGIVAQKSGNMAPLKCPILSREHSITEQSAVNILPIKPENATYYRKLWTHNFVGGASSCCFGVFIDGYIAGVFGYDKMTIALSGKGNRLSADLSLSFGISAPSDMRLNRLLYMLAMNRSTVDVVLDDLQKERVTGVATVMLTKYPESKEMRGLMKMSAKEKDKRCGFKLTYRADVKTRSGEETLSEWLKKERKWQKSRAASMN